MEEDAQSLSLPPEEGEGGQKVTKLPTGQIQVCESESAGGGQETDPDLGYVEAVHLLEEGGSGGFVEVFGNQQF
jgi:hypothetical protein